MKMSTVRGRVRAGTRVPKMGGMLHSGGALQPANGSTGNRVVLGTGAVVPWRALVAAALLSLLLGAALYEGLAGERSSVGAAHLRASSRLRPGASSQKKGLSSLPLAAQGPVSEALGADNPAYRVTASKGGFAAASPAQHLNASFDRSGVSRQLGRDARGVEPARRGLRHLAERAWRGRPAREGQSCLYARAGLSEWYVNGPLGLEQGFTIPRAPSAHPAGALTLSMTLSGNAHASLGSGGQSITFSRTGRPVLRYSGLSATDARGHALHSWLELHAGRILLRVDASGARYPLRIDPIVQQGGKLTGSGERGEEGDFGYSVALNATGEYALIGGPADNGGIGAAWVFVRESGKTEWKQQGAKLTGKEEAGAGEFGTSVALSEKGEYALIGGSGDNNGMGAAWVFLRESGKTTWAQQAKLTAKSGEEIGKGEFGKSVSLSATGEYALIGAPGDKEGIGAAWVFLRESGKTTWAQQGAKLIPKEKKKRSKKANSATAWRSPPKKANTR